MQEQEQVKSLEYFTQLANLLRAQGVPEEEIRRAILSQQTDPTPAALPFPGPVTGIDLAGNQPRLKVPDTGFPPVFIANPETSTDFIPSVGPQGYLSLPTPDPLGSVQTNTPLFDSNGSNLSHTYNITNYPATTSAVWLALSSDINSEFPTVGVTGYNFDMSVPPWRYDVEQSQAQPINMPPIAIYPSGITETTFEFNETIEDQREKDFDAASSFVGNVTYTPELQTMEITLNGKRYDYCSIPERIFEGFREASSKGAYYNRSIKGIYTCGTSETLQETIGTVNATWLDPDYIMAAKESAEKNGAKLYLVKAAEETITDHRSEGEQYLRKLAAPELQKMVRTAISKGTDINHMGEQFRTGGVIVDGEWDVNMEEMQYLVIESDAEINAAISRGDIDAVSINGGAPRREVVEPCDHNCNGGECQLCTVPVGVILAELDDIGFTWVAARPFMWRGNMIQAATPGIKTTVIQPL
ncbi:hypothetical protein LCGC14_1723470 [marine sediment metagenome]|uniref:KTSC domain-containing protein n=1 Tax=marine sediment metagenome TaxID=412755 RepID=A0A0F9HBU2_9ZZZZ